MRDRKCLCINLFRPIEKDVDVYRPVLVDTFLLTGRILLPRSLPRKKGIFTAETPFNCFAKGKYFKTVFFRRPFPPDPKPDTGVNETVL